LIFIDIIDPKKNTTNMPPKASKSSALEKKAAAQAVKDDRKAADDERVEAATWDVGANSKGAAKQKEAEEKAAAKAAKKAETETLLATEATAAPVAAKKTKKKGKDDFDKLNAALAAVPKTKAQKEAEAAAVRKEESRKVEEERKAKRELEKAAEDDMRAKAAARGIVLNHGDEMMIENHNRRDDEDELDATGLAAAVEVLTTGVAGAEVDKHPERRQKAEYKAYFDRQLPLLKLDHPGLKLSQYQERIFEAWKSSPENPKIAAKL
jgi:hypothetical protein